MKFKFKVFMIGFFFGWILFEIIKRIILNK
jgi:hypothetical protein